jgi:ATP-dependent DNA helicase DinG
MASVGRTLALFTSVAARVEAATAITRLVPYPILIQGSLPKRSLLERFASEEQACLFGTRSFFQGVDVPGSSLSLVALDRLPFPRPDDPLVAARSDAAGAAGFSRVVIPMTATSLAQAAGRLIRTSTDRGVVAVFDPRLARAAYRSDLLAALPPMRRTRTHDDVVAFLSDITKEGDRGVGNHAA